MKSADSGSSVPDSCFGQSEAGPRKVCLLNLSLIIHHKLERTRLICTIGTMTHRVMSISYLKTYKVSRAWDVVSAQLPSNPISIGAFSHPLRLSSIGLHTSRDGGTSASQDGPPHLGPAELESHLQTERGFVWCLPLVLGFTVALDSSRAEMVIRSL